MTAQEFLLSNLDIMQPFDDTADGIAAIMQAYADHCEASKWVRIEEKLPKLATYHLVYTSECMTTIAIWNHKHFISLDGIEMTYVTHWQPLPTPPKQ